MSISLTHLKSCYTSLNLTFSPFHILASSANCAIGVFVVADWEIIKIMLHFHPFIVDQFFQGKESQIISLMGRLWLWVKRLTLDPELIIIVWLCANKDVIAPNPWFTLGLESGVELCTIVNCIFPFFFVILKLVTW